LLRLKNPIWRADYRLLFRCDCRPTGETHRMYPRLWH
jgi:hypothetical protein